MSLLTSFIHTVSQKNREKKFELFLKHLAPNKNTKILDIGVTDKEYSPGDNYLEKHYAYPENITAVTNEPLFEFPNHYPNILLVQADATHLPFPDDSFDIAHSNAVIEHVGCKEQQLRFLQEIRRVANKGFLTTPNKYFPIELHTRIPLLHFILPKKLFDRFLLLIGKSWATGDYMYLLSEQELHSLLKKSGIKDYSLFKNRFLGIPMTFTVLWRK